jgi:hypothetical protein
MPGLEAPTRKGDVRRMGHHISAVILNGPFDEGKARSFDLKPIRLNAELTLFPLDAAYTDHWSDKLGIGQSLNDFPLLNTEPILHMLRSIADSPWFAVIYTDYCGGNGSQSAIAYRGEVELMPATDSGFGPANPHSFGHGGITLGPIGPINKALRLIGVTAKHGLDEFDTVGLGNHRDFYDLFEAYHDS